MKWRRAFVKVLMQSGRIRKWCQLRSGKNLWKVRDGEGDRKVKDQVRRARALVKCNISIRKHRRINKKKASDFIPRPDVLYKFSENRRSLRVVLLTINRLVSKLID
jgi:hypothetical protein